MSGIENDIIPSEREVNHHRKPNWPHVAVVGCMAVSLGATVVTGLKKSTPAHVVSSLCFVGSAMLHLFMHHRQLLHRVKNGFANGR
jgi:xanthosine utilization system XapX-like protein